MNFGKQQQRSTEFILDSDPFENIFYSLVVQELSDYGGISGGNKSQYFP